MQHSDANFGATQRQTVVHFRANTVRGQAHRISFRDCDREGYSAEAHGWGQEGCAVTVVKAQGKKSAGQHRRASDCRRASGAAVGQRGEGWQEPRLAGDRHTRDCSIWEGWASGPVEVTAGHLQANVDQQVKNLRT